MTEKKEPRPTASSRSAAADVERFSTEPRGPPGCAAEGGYAAEAPGEDAPSKEKKKPLLAPVSVAELQKAIAKMSEPVGFGEDELPSEILDGFLYLGDMENAASLPQLEYLGISHILSITTSEDLGEHTGSKMQRLFLHKRDDEAESLRPVFLKACAFIDGALQEGGRVLVHCMAGRSRSAALVLAYLMRARLMSLSDAFFHVKRRRPMILPNVAFWEQLMEEEAELFDGKRSLVPVHYVAGLEIRRKEKEEGDSSCGPKRYFDKYIGASAFPSSSKKRERGGDADSAEEKKKDSEEDDEGQSRRFREEAVRSLPEGWPGQRTAREVFLRAVEHMHPGARKAAARFLVELEAAGKIAKAEVREAFKEIIADEEFLADLRLDSPKVDAYISEMRAEAELLGLLPGSEEPRAAARVQHPIPPTPTRPPPMPPPSAVPVPGPRAGAQEPAQ